MISARILSAVAGAAMLSVAAAETATYVWSPTPVKPIPTPGVTLPANALTAQGCYDDRAPLDNYGPWRFQSPGNCQFICIELEKPVMALANGEECLCGDLVPPESARVKNGSCDTGCRGFPEATCGGPNMYEVFLTGTTPNRIEHYNPPKVSSSSSSSAAPSSTKAVKEETSTPTPTEKPEENKGPNKAGIAAGVVVGVVALAAIIGGIIFYLRQKKRKELEEEHRRRDLTSFISGGKLHTSNSSMTDSRLDPEFMNRRQSNGSIADNEDYSRRILKVTNA